VKPESATLSKPSVLAKSKLLAVVPAMAFATLRSPTALAKSKLLPDRLIAHP
jgi:hypothetical protein